MVSAGRHTICSDCNEDLVIQGDRELLATLLNNILDNAVKYSPAGSSIEVSAYRRADHGVCLRVRDYGRGISEEERQQVLEKYFRASTATDIPGMGLGLYLVDRIARLHNGTLDIDSNPGAGTTFTVCFPPLTNHRNTDNE